MSVSRHCAFYLAQNGKWYMELADREYGEHYDAFTWGPFDCFSKAREHLENFSNPGAYSVNESGNMPVPEKSPNGYAVMSPRGGRW